MKQTASKQEPQAVQFGPRGFYVKLAVAFLALLLALGTVQVLQFLSFSKQYHLETMQELGRGRASAIAQRVAPLVYPAIDYHKVLLFLYELQQEQPEYQTYLLDAEGLILVSLGSEENRVSKIELASINNVLKTGAPEFGATKGIDPKAPEELVPISAARIKLPKQDGFIYTVLSSEQGGLIADVVQSSYALRASLMTTFLSLLLASTLGLVLFFTLTRRLTRLTTVMHRFSTGASDARVRFRSNDEFGYLARTFNQMADRINQQVQDLEERDRLRRELMAAIAHDLRGPVAVAYGYADTLVGDDISLSGEQTKKAYQVLFDSMRYLGRLVDDLFELGKLEAKDISPVAAPFDVADVCSVAELRFAEEAAKNEISFTVSVSEGLPAVIGEQELIERVIHNLLSNGIKYTPPGGSVSLSALKVPQGIEVSVADTGEGIPEELQEKVFDSFFRVDSKLATERGGTGLGLAIVKKILDAHKIAIQLKSDPQSGSRFSFVVPLAIDSQAELKT